MLAFQIKGEKTEAQRALEPANVPTRAEHWLNSTCSFPSAKLACCWN